MGLSALKGLGPSCRRRLRGGAVALVSFGFGLIALLVALTPAFPQTSASQFPIQAQFRIVSQPLDAALKQYGELTGREALYDASLASGLVSGDVNGVLTADDALVRLLYGTGLSARFVADNAFVLLRTPQSTRQPARSNETNRRYYGLMQNTVLDILCRSQIARPGRYRLVAMFWIGSDGRIREPRLIGAAGPAGSDQQIGKVLQSVKFAEPPPPEFAQPVLMLIAPAASGIAPACDMPGAIPIAAEPR